MCTLCAKKNALHTGTPLGDSDCKGLWQDNYIDDLGEGRAGI